MKRLVAVVLAVMMFGGMSVSAGALTQHDAGMLFGKHATKHVKVVQLKQRELKKAKGENWNSAMGALCGGAAYTGYQAGRWAAGGGWGWNFNDFSVWSGWGAIFSWW
jgi:hypothetical protein